MATYYVRKTGNDGNAGTSAGAAWLTIGKALGASGIASGDTVYVGSGTFRETVTVAMTSAVAETSVIADVDGSKTGDAGPVIWTAYTTNDTTAPAASPPLNLSARDFLTFEGFYFVGGNNSRSIVNAYDSVISTNITFRKCVFVQNGAQGIMLKGSSNTPANWTMDRCIFHGTQSPAYMVYLEFPTVSGADYDVNVQVKNCLFLGGPAAVHLSVTTTGALANKPGGVDVFNCTFSGTLIAYWCQTANISTSIPCTCYNSLIYDTEQCLRADAAGELVEDYNHLIGGTERTNVSAGSNSKSADPTAYAQLFDFGYSWLNGLQPRPHYMPLTGAPQLGFGNQAGGPTTDHLGRPRPAGGGSTSYGIGAFERHDTAAKETSVTDAGSTACKIVGPGDHDLLIPVDASATNLTIRVRYDTNHGTGSKPQAILLAAADIGVSTETKTATAGVDTWETLTFSSFTPTAKGYVTLRLVSRAAAGNGIAYFDTLTGGASSSAGFDYFTKTELPSGMVAGGTGGSHFIG